MTLIQKEPQSIKICVELTPLCFTANTANSTVQLTKDGNPTEVSLETSTDLQTWSDYTIGNTITLSNIGDKVYMRNKSETDTLFSNSSNFYKFVMTGSIAGGGNITSLLNKNGTNTLSDYCFLQLFYGCTSLTTTPLLPATNLANGCYSNLFNSCTSLTTVPELPATTLAQSCYFAMFQGCTSLTSLPELPATTLPNYCYRYMFRGCTNIKLSTSQTGEYQTPYRIPTTGSGTTGNLSLDWMFQDTGGTFTGTPTVNTTYYTSNTVVPATTSPVKDVQKVYIGSTQVRPKLRTFTITWEEKSDMSSGWTYSDDAAGLTAGSTAFDEFFGYSAVRLNTSGQETAEITQAQSGGAGKLDITQLGDLTTGDNVMIKFPVRGIKMTKSGNYVTLSITEELNKTGYQYYAHKLTWNSASTPKDNLYIGAYKGGLKEVNNSTRLCSLSGKGPARNTGRSTFFSYLENGNLIGFYQRMYIAALYMMKYGNPDCQSVVGMGYVGGSTRVNTGGTNSQTDATYGTSSNTAQIKLFGLEDWWGNLREFLGNAQTGNQESGQYWVYVNGTRVTTFNRGRSGYIGNIYSTDTNNTMFLAQNTYSSNSYYKDYTTMYEGYLCKVGGDYSSANSAGIFNLQFNGSDGDNYTGTRIMYL